MVTAAGPDAIEYQTHVGLNAIQRDELRKLEPYQIRNRRTAAAALIQRAEEKRSLSGLGSVEGLRELVRWCNDLL